MPCFTPKERKKIEVRSSFPTCNPYNFFLFYIPNPHILSAFNVVASQKARLGFYFPTTRCRGAGIQTHVTLVSRVAPTRDLYKGGLSNELPRRGAFIKNINGINISAVTKLTWAFSSRISFPSVSSPEVMICRKISLKLSYKNLYFG